ncbi:MAG: nitroreductase family protein [Desulfobacterales bacterium]|nr:nitroreductase family protein [Desulfobacterales bacterium]
MEILHDEGICISCGSCVETCLRRNFQYDEHKKVQLIKNSVNNCLLCGHCLAVCPKDGALKLKGNNEELKKVLPPPSPEIIYNFIASRRSIRRFTSKIPTKEQIETLVDIGRYAPSGHNSQDFNFIVVFGHDKVKSIGKIALQFYEGLINRLNTFIGRQLIKIFAGNKTFNNLEKMEPRLRRHIAIYKETGSIEMVWDAPCLILIHGPDKHDSAINSSLAGYNIILQAHSMGLGTCILGLLREGLIRQVNQLNEVGIKIPGGNNIHMIICVGIPQLSSKYLKIPPRNSANVTYINTYL